MTKEITETVATLEAQCEIIRSMNDLYNTDEYPTMQPVFAWYNDFSIPLAYAFDSEIVTVDGITPEYEGIVQEFYLVLLNHLGLKEPENGFRSFDQFHEAMKAKFK